ncbi:hypothetical protein J6590_005298 [Homalodisca vitripennis]|nr:hypothetical protein J6590_005298 [Homalodisca vitripennis]
MRLTSSLMPTVPKMYLKTNSLNLKLGGFELRKWDSNSPKRLQELPVFLKQSDNPHWSSQNDSLSYNIDFSIEIPNKMLTVLIFRLSYLVTHPSWWTGTGHKWLQLLSCCYQSAEQNGSSALSLVPVVSCPQVLNAVLTCAVNIIASDIVIKCVDCALLFHSFCTNLGSSQNLTKQRVKSWKCELCKGESALTVSNKSNDDVADGTKNILDAIRSMDTKINTNVGQVRGSLDSLREEFQRLNDEVQDLQQRLNDSDQHSRCANIEIIGLPTTEGEDIYTAFEKIACTTVTDISEAPTLAFLKKKHAYAPILVQFVYLRMREAWLAASKSKRGLKSTQISASLPESHVFNNEQLTPHNKTLLGRARRMQREDPLRWLLQQRSADQTC